MTFDKLREAVAHPLAAASAAAGGLAGLFHWSTVEALGGALWVNAGNLLTVGTLTGFTLPRVFPEFAGLKQYALPLVAVGAVLVVVRLAYRTYRDTDKRL